MAVGLVLGYAGRAQAVALDGRVGAPSIAGSSARSRDAPTADAYAVAPAAMRGVHATDPQADAALAEAAASSAIVREQLSALARTDVIVLLAVRTMRGFETSATWLVIATPVVRVLRVDIDGRRTGVDRLATLGHELQHALELAVEARVTNAATARRYFRQIGRPSTYSSFETQAAIDVACRVAAQVRRARRRHLTR